MDSQSLDLLHCLLNIIQVWSPFRR
jgi:hypothetical protein